MEFIQVTKENLEKEHICCAITNNKDVQVSSKKSWLEQRFDEGLVFLQVIAKLAMLVRNLEPRQGRIRAEHESWNEKGIIASFRRTLISPRLYGVGKSYAMRGFKLRMYS